MKDLKKWYDRLHRVPAIILHNDWHYLMGAIGNTTITLEAIKEIDRDEYSGNYEYKRRKKGKDRWDVEWVKVPITTRTGFTYVGSVGWELYYRVTKELTWNEHPNWRPICYFYPEKRFLESWHEIAQVLAWDGGQRLEIYKHPEQ